MDQDTITPAKALALLAALALAIAWAIGCFLVLRPFLSALLWAAILVYSTWPAFRLLREKLRLSSRLGRARDGPARIPAHRRAAVPRRAPAPRRDGRSPRVGGGVPHARDAGHGRLARPPAPDRPLFASWTEGFDFGITSLVELGQPYAGTVAQTLLTVLLAVLSGIAEVFLAIFFAFFLYRDGVAIAAWSETTLTRWPGCARAGSWRSPATSPAAWCSACSAPPSCRA